jgi:DNA-binding transcriptional ArsR family regulator
MAAAAEAAPATAARSRKRDAAVAAAELDARFFRGLGDPTRLRILQLLLEGERSVGEIVAALGGLQGRISSHLMCLRWCGYVTTRREGRRVYYSVTDPRVREILRLAQSMRRDHAESLAACAVIEPAG